MFISRLKSVYFRLVRSRHARIPYFFFKLCFFFPRTIRAHIALKNIGSNPIDSFERLEQRWYSQNGEDGILKALFSKIGTTNRFAVEFGIHPNEGNTVHLRNNGWNCLWMDGEGDVASVEKEFITAENINTLFSKYNVPQEPDLVSIDTDYNDYWLWKALEYRPRVVVIEYNSSIPVDESKTVPYKSLEEFSDVDFQAPKTTFFGASLLALQKLGTEKGYTLVTCDRKGVNAFFVRNDLLKNHFTKRPIEAIFQPPGYRRYLFFGPKGHRPTSKTEEFVSV